MSSVRCDSVNPDTGSLCYKPAGHGGQHFAHQIESWDTPYRMAEPTSRKALVVDDGKVWRPVFGPAVMWESDDDYDWVAWEVLTDPQPYQNCTLTVNDPEPPIGSVVLDEVRQVWRRGLIGWETTGSNRRYDWPEIFQLNFRSGDFTLLYRGEA